MRNSISGYEDCGVLHVPVLRDVPALRGVPVLHDVPVFRAVPVLHGVPVQWGGGGDAACGHGRSVHAPEVPSGRNARLADGGNS